MPARRRGEPRGPLGMFHPLRPSGGTVFGANVAVDDFVAALGRHGRGRTELWAPAAVAPALDALEARRQPRGRSRVRVHGFSAFAQELRGRPFRAWHDIGGDVIRGFYLRSQFLARARFPVTVTHHSFSYESSRLAWFVPLLLGDVRPSDALICTSQAARAAIRVGLEHAGELLGAKRAPRFRGRLEVIPLGVDTERFTPRPKAPLRARLGLPEKAFVILWMGRLSALDKADLLPLVQVFARLRVALPRAGLTLVLAGSDRERDSAYLRDFAARLGVARHVRVLTEAPPSERHLLHAAADVFVSPADNIQETFGLTPIEAMACGVPQVVSDWDGYRDTVAHGVTGFLVPTRMARLGPGIDHAAPLTGAAMLDHLALAQSTVVDVDGLEAGLMQLVTQPQLRARMGEASRARAVRTYAWRRVISAYEDLWEELERASRSARPRRSGGTLAYLPPQNERVFAGYPSAWMTGSEVIEITELGRDVLLGASPIAAYHEGAGFDLTLAGELLARLARARAGVVMSRLARAESGRFQVMWLMKLGLARVRAERSSP